MISIIRDFRSKSTMEIVFILVLMMVLCECGTSSDLKKFTEHGVIPDVLKVGPKYVLQVNYPNGASVDLGNVLTPTQMKMKPQVTWEAEKGAYYSLIMTDPDAPSRADPEFREIRHWLVMNILENDVKSGDEVVEYIGAGPPKGTGLHRYIFLVFKQPNGKIIHNLPHTTDRSMNNRPKTFTLEFTKQYDLSDPDFGNFCQAEYDEYSDILLKQIGFAK